MSKEVTLSDLDKDTYLDTYEKGVRRVVCSVKWIRESVHSVDSFLMLASGFCCPRIELRAYGICTPLGNLIEGSMLMQEQFEELKHRICLYGSESWVIMTSRLVDDIYQFSRVSLLDSIFGIVDEGQ